MDQFFVTPYGMELGASASLAFYYAAILNGGAFFGCYALGIIADSGLGFFNSLTITVFACAIAAFGWIGTKTNAGTIVWVVIYGLLSGAIQAIFSPCLSLLAPTPEVIGIWNGESPSYTFRSNVSDPLCQVFASPSSRLRYWLQVRLLGSCSKTADTRITSPCSCSRVSA